MTGTVTVRMYNVGFGDAFLVTVRRNDATWRMLIDCGVHNQGRARPIREVVDAVIADLRAAADDGVPRLDVIASTHRHADHISGFSIDSWAEVEVAQVWLPFVADDQDPDTRSLRHEETARLLLDHIAQRTRGLAADQWPPALATAQAFALNSLSNADAMDLLLCRNGRHFATTPRIVFLPDRDDPDTPIPLPGIGGLAHVLGPSRDPEQLKRMSPPAQAGWLALDPDAPLGGDTGSTPLFDPVFEVQDPSQLPGSLEQTRRSLRLHQLNNDAGLLSAASILERAVNNTSLFLVLDVAGTRLVFPGDAQYGAWDHVLSTPSNRALLADAAFYKIGHHGSHNATPKSFVEEIWHDGGHAMLPYGMVTRWKDSIPKRELLEALDAHQHVVTRADDPSPAPDVVVHDDLWSEVTITTR